MPPIWGHGPGRKFTVPVFAQNVGMNIVGVDVAVAAQKVPEARTIKHRARANHPASGKPGALERHVGEHVNGVAHHQKDRRRVAGCYLIHYIISVHPRE